MSAKEFDRRFDNGEDISDYLDLKNVRRPGRDIRRVNVDFPSWMVDRLDEKARRLGINRQAVIKTLLAEHLQKEPG
ncbi:MAG: ribbon-helix-helix protein, CopG family [Phycisphaerae bacterium]|nr:ribbon-helix-helix protein, CopG family [Phycisphaerae bacterium]